MSPIKIAIGGVHSTGKTTFLKHLREVLERESIETGVVSDLASRCPLPILRQHTVESTMWIVSTGIAEELAAGHQFGVVLVDRPVVDAWAYLMGTGKDPATFRDSPVADTLLGAIKSWVPTYTLVYQTVLDENIPINDDKNRDLDPIYRREVASQMDQAYKSFAPERRLLSAASTEPEIQFVLDTVKARLSTIEH